MTRSMFTIEEDSLDDRSMSSFVPQDE